MNQCIDALSSTSSLQNVRSKSLSKTLQNPTAFSVLMSSHKENNAWKEASDAEKNKAVRGRRPAPFYKAC